jgi:hypothetical protein
MKKEERLLKIAGTTLIIVIVVFLILLSCAVYATIMGNRSDAAFLLLWAIAIDIIFTGMRNVAVEKYNDKIDKEQEEQTEELRKDLWKRYTEDADK